MRREWSNVTPGGMGVSGFSDSYPWDATEPFWDSTLSVRVAEVLHDWMVRAQREIEVQSGGMADARAEAVRQIEAKTEELQAILDGVRVDVTDFNLPELPDVPEPVLTAVSGTPLLDTRQPFRLQSRLPVYNLR
jgi:hypothetical protein